MEYIEGDSLRVKFREMALNRKSPQAYIGILWGQVFRGSDAVDQ